MSKDEWLQTLPVQEPRVMLMRLAEYSQKCTSWPENKIEVTLYLAQGQTLTGFVARAGRQGQQDIIWLTREKEQEGTLLCVALADVIALQVSGPYREAMATPSERAQQGPPPTRLQLKRELDEKNNAAKNAGLGLTIECLWDTINQSDDETLHLADTLSALYQTIEQVGASDLGKTALNDVTRLTVRSQPGSSLDVKREGASLSLIFDARKPVAGDVNEQIKRRLEAAL
jgi:hypothetical protein